MTVPFLRHLRTCSPIPTFSLSVNFGLQFLKRDFGKDSIPIAQPLESVLM